MKKIVVTTILICVTLGINAQDISSIVDKYEKATGIEKLNSFKTMKVIGNMSQMGMNMPILMLEKNPDKIKVTSTISGAELVQVVNGDRGYMINPMMGSSDPIELPAEQVVQIKNNRMLRSSLRSQLDESKLELVGEETFNGKSVFNIKSQTDAGEVFMLIDKESYYVVASRMSVNNMGTDTSVEIRMSNYTDFQGVIIAMKMETFMNGQPSGSIEYNSIEFDIPIDDSEFIIK